MSDYEAGLLVRNSELLFVLEPLLRQARIDRKDQENADYDEAFYDGVIFAYKNAIALIKREK